MDFLPSIEQDNELDSPAQDFASAAISYRTMALIAVHDERNKSHYLFNNLHQLTSQFTLRDLLDKKVATFPPLPMIIDRLYHQENEPGFTPVALFYQEREKEDENEEDEDQKGSAPTWFNKVFNFLF